MNIRNHIRGAISDGLVANFAILSGQSGVVFHDENEFIPFAVLNYNSDVGYFDMSRHPEFHCECENENPETLHYGRDYSEDWKPLIWADDGGNLTLIGDTWNAADLYQALHAFLFDGVTNAEEISQDDPAWGHMRRIDWAVEEYREYVPGAKKLTKERVANTIRAAARRGAIRGCTQDDRSEWYFRPAAFRGWLVKTAIEKRGRPKRSNAIQEEKS